MEHRGPAGADAGTIQQIEPNSAGKHDCLLELAAAHFSTRLDRQKTRAGFEAIVNLLEEAIRIGGLM